MNVTHIFNIFFFVSKPPKFIEFMIYSAFFNDKSYQGSLCSSRLSFVNFFMNVSRNENPRTLSCYRTDNGYGSSTSAVSLCGWKTQKNRGTRGARCGPSISVCPNTDSAVSTPYTLSKTNWPRL